MAELGKEESGVIWGVEKDHPWLLYPRLHVYPLHSHRIAMLYASPHQTVSIPRASMTFSSCLGPHLLGRGGSQCVCYVNDGRQTDTQTRFFLASIPNPGEWLEARERELGPGEEDDDWIWGLKLPDNFSFFFLVLSLSLWQPSCSPCVHIHHYKTGHRRRYICLVQCDILTVLQRTWHIVVAQYF